MPTDREIAEAARDDKSGDWNDVQLAFMDRFTPEHVLALLEVVEEARDARDGEETNWGALARYLADLREIGAVTER